MSALAIGPRERSRPARALLLKGQSRRARMLQRSGHLPLAAVDAAREDIVAFALDVAGLRLDLARPRIRPAVVYPAAASRERDLHELGRESLAVAIRQL